MLDNIYLSTACFQSRNLGEILEFCLKESMTNIELGSNIAYSGDNVGLALKFKQAGMRFIIHNYFPAPKKGFVLNLASDDKDIEARSISFCKEAVDLSAAIGAPFYSVHAGFAFHARPEDLNMPQAELPRIPYRKAYDIFVKNIRLLAGYGSDKGVKIAVENNVVAEFNLIGGKNELLLLADGEALAFYKDVGSENLFYLIDLGHLKINSALLNFDSFEYLGKIMPHSLAFHLSDNNSRLDGHLKFTEDAWFKGVVAGNKEKVFIVEANGLRKEDIRGAYEALEKMLLN